MNVPFNKAVDEITKDNPFLNGYPNRQQRRESLQKNRAKGNHCGISLSVGVSYKYYRTTQLIHLKEGGTKIISHQNFYAN